MRSIKEVRYLSTQEVIEVHRRITDLFFVGYERVPPTQRYEILSLPLLESAVHRPQQTFKGRDLYKTIYQKAAALLRSIISNHPFLDGNKRTAITATALFLLFNGVLIERKRLTDYVLKIAEGKVEGKTEKQIISNIARWLKNNSSTFTLTTKPPPTSSRT